MTAKEARRQSLNNELDFIMTLIKQTVQRGQTFLLLNYEINNLTKEGLINLDYNVTAENCLINGREQTYIEW